MNHHKLKYVPKFGMPIFMVDNPMLMLAAGKCVPLLWSFEISESYNSDKHYLKYIAKWWLLLNYRSIHRHIPSTTSTTTGKINKIHKHKLKYSNDITRRHQNHCSATFINLDALGVSYITLYVVGTLSLGTFNIT